MERRCQVHSRYGSGCPKPHLLRPHLTVTAIFSISTEGGYSLPHPVSISYFAWQLSACVHYITDPQTLSDIDESAWLCCKGSR